MGESIDIGRKIRDMREQRNLSQDKFGKKIGKTGKTICAYERGRCTPPLRVLEDISQVYDVTFTSVKQSRATELTNKIQQLKDVLIDFEKILCK
jgi:transcriptional regulator with XRE-family HTH domain